MIVDPVESPAGLYRRRPGEPGPWPCRVELTAGGRLRAVAVDPAEDEGPAPAGDVVGAWPLPAPVPADVANALLGALVPLAEQVLAGGRGDRGLDEAARTAGDRIQGRCEALECDITLADADEVVRCLADPDDETLLSAALLARSWLALDAHTTDEVLASIVEDADVQLREQMQVVSDQTTQALQRLRDVLRVHEVAAALPLQHQKQDCGLIAAAIDQAGPMSHLTPEMVRDVVTQTITRARAQAVEDAVAAVRGAYTAIDQAEIAHREEMLKLKATLRDRIEAAVAAGRPIGLLSGDIQLTRQRIHQIRNNTR